jgi:hypothetical protein
MGVFASFLDKLAVPTGHFSSYTRNGIIGDIRAAEAVCREMRGPVGHRRHLVQRQRVVTTGRKTHIAQESYIPQNQRVT